jgi:8-oxo-dGTP pyrophosphatase MutT (NUDIX family)
MSLIAPAVSLLTNYVPCVSSGQHQLQLNHVPAPELSEAAKDRILYHQERLDNSANDFNGPILMCYSLHGSQANVYLGDYACVLYLLESGDHSLGVGPMWCGTILHNSQGQILLARRAAGLQLAPGQWNLPSGGAMEGGESAKTAMLREMSEELGENAAPAISNLNYSGFSVSVHPPGLGMVWQGQIEDISLLQTEEEEISELAWHDPNNLPENVKADILPILQAWAKKQSDAQETATLQAISNYSYSNQQAAVSAALAPIVC